MGGTRGEREVRLALAAPSFNLLSETFIADHARRLAPGQLAPMRKRRPSPGAYGPDYNGPRPRNIPEELGGATRSES